MTVETGFFAPCIKPPPNYEGQCGCLVLAAHSVTETAYTDTERVGLAWVCTGRGGAIEVTNVRDAIGLGSRVAEDLNIN